MLIAAALGAALIAAEPAADPLPDLRAAQAIRTTTEAEARAWNDERARLEAAIAALDADAARDRQLAAAATSATAALADDPATTVRRRLAEALDAAGVALANVLADTARRSLPGLVPAPAATGLDPACDALESATRTADIAEVRILTGRTAEGPRAARVLRLGLHRAWWLAIDGSAGGPVAIADDSQLTFLPTDAAGRAAIRDAIDQLDGRTPPAWLALPVAGGKP